MRHCKERVDLSCFSGIEGGRAAGVYVEAFDIAFGDLSTPIGPRHFGMGGSGPLAPGRVLGLGSIVYVDEQRLMP